MLHRLLTDPTIRTFLRPAPFIMLTQLLKKPMGTWHVCKLVCTNYNCWEFWCIIFAPKATGEIYLQRKISQLMVYGVYMLCCIECTCRKKIWVPQIFINVAALVPFGVLECRKKMWVAQIFINVVVLVPFGVLETIAVTHWGLDTFILGEYNQQHRKWSS